MTPENQITPFNFTTPDHETIYAWHVMPLGLYAKHEAEILRQPSGCAEDITQTKAFRLLQDDPESRLVINFHGNAGTVAQGWRTDSYRALADGSTSNIHILAIDYRGFGLSTGFPTEAGLIIDGIAAVDWAIQVAKIPPGRIVILGQSLGTAVTAAVVEHYAQERVELAGVVLVAGFTTLPELLPGYSIGGLLPVLSPLKAYPTLLRLFTRHVVDQWPSTTRLANFVRASKKIRLFIVHSRDDHEIPWGHAERLFITAANATTERGMDLSLLKKMKAQATVDMGDGAFVSTWKADENKIIREEIVSYGHVRVKLHGVVSENHKGRATETMPTPPAHFKHHFVPSTNTCPAQSQNNTMADDSTAGGSTAKQKAAEQVIEEPNAPNSQNAQVDSGNEDEEDAPADGTAASSSAAKKKKSKRKRIKSALAGGGGSSEASGSAPSKSDMSKAISGLSKDQIGEILKMNPSLARDLGVTGGDVSVAQAAEKLKKLSLEEILSGLASSGKNVKDMGEYKFWQTQPVPRLGDKEKIEKEGPIREVNLDLVRKEPYPMAEGFEWVTIDIQNPEELREVFELLHGHYVEDDEAMFRFNYSPSFLKWALLSPGWQKEWHVGLRATQSRKLVAFISAIPVQLRVRENVLSSSEVNFMVVHKKLRSKRLTPVLIKEITRRCNLNGVYQAIYTAGIVLPKPFSTCRYFHRSLDWQKLYEVGFSPCPKNSKPQYQVRKYQLPEHTATKGLRPMELKDVDAVLDLLRRYLARFDIAPEFTKEEVEHWLLHQENKLEEQDPSTKKIRDFFSFYCLESSVINHPQHSVVRAAYLFYYATETVFSPDSTKQDLKTHLNALVNDALIIAKRFKFDVFNALTLLDNTLFLEQQKFGAGDGQLHYYLYNYNANPIAGGVDAHNNIDEKGGSGVGVVML
ncbi:Glycylpeptide N-tetradecanoyltransferase [Venustampulla echinocandica]|uniref:Glycylpeptide N-tetradecanoyltransferase n=1 Tax=Venustampulla echinocandica TaxID=2656787 RepID=A0A370TB68_9HELO|nr:Glycylpeptide N-tetradecanoyltransferase [Venustampulla echinocandica]RDL31158.1 Glycylpeptide N-tetradecanoyltransferase [Venustampulla echinocandica]